MRSWIKTHLPRLAAFLLIAGLTAPQLAAAPDDPERFTLRLGAAEIEPAAGRWTPPHEAGVPFLLQLYELPGEDEVERWRARGITLLSYVGGNAYIVRTRGEGDKDLATEPKVRAALTLEPEMKRSKVFDSDPVLAARSESGEPLGLHLSFFPGVPFERARALLGSLGIDTDQQRYAYGRSIAVRAARRQLEELLVSRDVAWADPQLPPARPASRSAGERARVDRILDRPGFKGADGSGVSVGVWDWYSRGIGHSDLEGRVVRTWMRPRDESLHGLWVSGTLAGAGTVDPRARGMAPGATLHWYSWYPDLWSRMADARTEHGVRITNHSWARVPGWMYVWDAEPPFWTWSSEVWAFGYYHAWTAAADELALSTDVLVVIAACNRRELSYIGPHAHIDMLTGELIGGGPVHEDLHPLNPEYTSMAGPALGKNVLTVGAVTKDDAMSWFSNWGPTGDGRVKPDVVAVGVDVRTTTEGDGYVTDSGTSLATPVVTGSAALLADYYSRLHHAEPSALLLKALLVHGARDLGRPGPDYVHGHGMVDAQLSARVLRAAARGEPRLESLVVERRLAHGQKKKAHFEVPPGAHELRATLVWHDVPGERLVNDLDLWLVSPSRNAFRPFVLDPERPRAAAVTGVNRIDNVESVRVSAPEPGPWRAVVRASRVPMGPQSYALIVSAGDGNLPQVELSEGACGITQFYATDEGPESPTLSRRKNVFRHRDPFYLTTRFYVPENADYGEFYGSIHVIWTVSDNRGNVIVKETKTTTQTHVLAPEWGSFFTERRYWIPRDLPSGEYVAQTVVRMHNGAECAAAYSFRVEN